MTLELPAPPAPPPPQHDPAPVPASGLAWCFPAGGGDVEPSDSPPPACVTREPRLCHRQPVSPENPTCVTASLCHQRTPPVSPPACVTSDVTGDVTLPWRHVSPHRHVSRGGEVTPPPLPDAWLSRPSVDGDGCAPVGIDAGLSDLHSWRRVPRCPTSPSSAPARQTSRGIVCYRGDSRDEKRRSFWSRDGT